MIFILNGILINILFLIIEKYILDVIVEMIRHIVIMKFRIILFYDYLRFVKWLITPSIKYIRYLNHIAANENIII